MTKTSLLSRLCLFSLSGAILPQIGTAQIVINEFQYDDAGTDDREFIELFNPTANSVDISGWILTGRDATTINPTATIPAGTIIAPGGFYVLGNANVLNVNQVIAVNFLENDNETIELTNGGVVIDALAYETNKGVGFAAPVASEVGPGIFGNSQGGVDLPGPPLNTTVSLGRFVDGRDTNNNGRDFGLRPSTPGTTNAPGGRVTTFQLRDPSPLATGTALDQTAGSFVNALVIEPGTVSTANPNAIAAPNGGFTKAYTAWDPSGGGNGITSNAVFDTNQAKFTIQAYFDTRALPVQSNASGVEFKGSEVTIYGIGSGDALTNLTDLTGAVGLGAGTLPVADTANGFTGFAWVYEKVGVAPGGGTPASHMLHLVDANDGGDSSAGGNTPLDWTILASYSLPTTSSGDWYELSIDLRSDGTGTGIFAGQQTLFSTNGFHSGAFNVGYRENLQIGADGTPDALLRPATFAPVPEPATAVLWSMGMLALLRRRR